MDTKKTNKRDDIIEASLDLIAEHGFHGTPMSLIAEQAGVGAGTIYRYFESKDVLIKELFAELEAKITAALLEGYSEKKPLRERFIYLCERLLRYFLDNPVHFRFMEQYYNSPYGVALRRDKFLDKGRQRDVFRELLEEGMAQQVIKDFPIHVHAALTFSPIVCLARDHVLGLIKLDDKTIMKTIEACWDGIKR
jgi:AcrR family transcriptional regulator